MTLVIARQSGPWSSTATWSSAPSRIWAAVLVGIGALAFIVRIRLLVQSGGLLSADGYDDGVYYAAADALVHGRLPYRDFLLLQPPGTIDALAPFAWLGSVTRDSVGVEVARLCFIGVGALNAVLTATVARRFGGTAAVLAGIGYAVFLPAAFAERSTLLEPLGTGALLLGVMLAGRATQRPRLGMLVAGAVAGIALGMRIWYVVPVLLIGVFQRRLAPRFTAGAAAVAVTIYLPFLAASPAGLIREILLDQLGRPRATAQTPAKRVLTFLGATDLHLQQPWAALLSVHKVGLLLAVVVVVCGIVACTVHGARLFPVMTAATSLVLLASPSFFLHYAALTAPWLVLTVSIGAAKLLSLVRARRAAVALTALLLLATVVLDLRAVEVARPSTPIPVAALRPAALAVHGCVIADDPQILAALDVLSRDLGRGCAIRPDVTGYSYDRDSASTAGGYVPRRRNPIWQADVTRYLRSGNAVIVHRAATSLNTADARLVRSGPVLATSGSWTLHAVPH